jgi:malonyl-CoA O-methyltransferase
MFKPNGVDPVAVRKQFDRRGAALSDADFLLRDVEEQMFERFDPIRIAPTRIVDLGCGLGDGLVKLRRRFPNATALGVDHSASVLRAARSRIAPAPTGVFGRLLSRVSPAHRPLAEFMVADAANVPLADSSTDLIWSNCCLHWLADPGAAIEQWHRIIKPGGLVMFSMFGVDTLTQLRGLGADLMTFHDMHDIGDALVQTGFADPVMDMHLMTLEFSEPERLVHDLHALGGNAMGSRDRSMSSRDKRAAWLERLLQMRDSDGKFRVSFEVCFGHAWCPDQKRLPRGLSRVEFHSNPDLKSGDS